MKIRTAFVSNSSSSNFCVMGFELPGHYEREDVLKLLGFQFDKNDERDEDDYEDDYDGEYEEDYEEYTGYEEEDDYDENPF